MNPVLYNAQGRSMPRKVWFSGSTALFKGQGLCYDLDYVTTETGETATDKWAKRANTVQVPAAANSLAFAGVAAQNYVAVAGGQYIEINEPGSICEVAIAGVATTINATMVTCSIGPDAGRFTLGGFNGRGSALALETMAIAAKTGLAFASLDGTAVEATSAGVVTITKTAIGTACGYGDTAEDPTQYKVAILGGGDDDEVVTPKIVNVLTAPTADTITVSAASGTTPYISLYVYKGNPTILAKLLDGEESGLVEFVSPADNADAQHALPGGVTFVCGGYTMTTGDSDSVLADGVIQGQRKGFAGLGTLTTKDYLVAVTSGLVLAGTALSTIAIDAAGEHISLAWSGNFGTGTTGLWRSIESTATEA